MDRSLLGVQSWPIVWRRLNPSQVEVGLYCNADTWERLTLPSKDPSSASVHESHCCGASPSGDMQATTSDFVAPIKRVGDADPARCREILKSSE